MRRAYETMLLLYPPLHRTRYGREMVDVFDEATGEYETRGHLAYLAFLLHEFTGIMAGALAMWTDECAYRSRRRFTAPFVASVAAGALITAVWQGLVYRGVGGINRGLPLLERMPQTPHAPINLVEVLVLASACLLLISIFSVAFVWNMRTLGNRAGIIKPLWMPGRANARIARRD